MGIDVQIGCHVGGDAGGPSLPSVAFVLREIEAMAVVRSRSTNLSFILMSLTFADWAFSTSLAIRAHKNEASLPAPGSGSAFA